jgi:class 3 adenylate cyclase
VITCPSCSHEWPDGAKFCMDCGTALAPPSAIPEERKVVTTLFCDLVGFTSMSEAADPEDVAALLGEYSARAKKVIESHGGTVEKFIGDAVVGVFGVPATHEDDPERAVRAGLRLLEALEGFTRPDDTPLEARVGVNTGEALVRLDVDPASGRGFVTGDAVNTAARLQAAAPPGGVAVGNLTHDLTSQAVHYEELPPVVAKGKAEVVKAWQAVATLARRGIDVRTSDLTPLVGREVELSYLSAIFDKASSRSAPQFVLVVGEPGIGKSRLVGELAALVDARPQMTTWRQGHCPPFGEDITYWALAGIVKGHAGIRDTDDVPAVKAKLDAILPSGRDREWFRQRLGALLGLAAPEASREENFTAWMRLFEDLAAREPLVLVFEDLHWADEALLAFLEYLTTHIAAVPLLVVGTARPELFERRPGFATGSRVNRLELEPLSIAETVRLVASLLDESDDHARVIGQVVDRCDGNPCPPASLQAGGGPSAGRARELRASWPSCLASWSITRRSCGRRSRASLPVELEQTRRLRSRPGACLVASTSALPLLASRAPSFSSSREPSPPLAGYARWRRARSAGRRRSSAPRATASGRRHVRCAPS